MTEIDTQRVQQMFDYLYNPTIPLQRADGAIVFGRADPLVAAKAAEIHHSGLTGYLLFTGGIGKDSGFLTRLKIPESHYLALLSVEKYGINSDVIYIEPNARNGGQCWENSIDTIRENSLPHGDLTILIHPTSLRRIHATGQVIGPRKGFEASYQRAGTNYTFDPSNPTDQREAVGELLRLADWPALGYCVKQDDLPADLVSYAREIKGRI